MTSVETFVVSSTEPVDALGLPPVVPGSSAISASESAFPLPVAPAGAFDDEEADEDDADDAEVPLGIPELELLELGVVLPLTGEVTVSDELAGQLSCSSEVSCAFAAFSALLSALTVASAASNVDA
jgi:hypothetical protein